MQPAYNFGVILNYLFHEKSLEEICDTALPLHVVEKKIPYMNESGEFIKPEEPFKALRKNSVSTQ